MLTPRTDDTMHRKMTQDIDWEQMTQVIVKDYLTQELEHQASVITMTRTGSVVAEGENPGHFPPYIGKHPDALTLVGFVATAVLGAVIFGALALKRMR